MESEKKAENAASIDVTAAKIGKAMPLIDIDKIAALSKLSISDKERAELQKDMNDIIGFANKLSELDGKLDDKLDDISSVQLQNVFREDVIGRSTERDELLQNAPTKNDKYITVPRVVEG